jgi:signal transduction histidine kinase
MQNRLNSGKASLVALTLLVATLSFVVALSTVIYVQSKYLFTQKIESAVQNAERLSQLDKSITFDRALRIYAGNLAFTIFDEDCEAFYSSDLLIIPSSCLSRDPRFEWSQFKSLFGRQFIIGHSSAPFKLSYLTENRHIILLTSVSYIVFVLIITLLFLNIFIERPIRKISSSITKLLDTQEIDPNEFTSSKDKILKELYLSISKLIAVVIKSYGEREKHLLSQQIAHDLRAPLAALEDHLINSSHADSIETMAIRRISSIADSLMPSSQLPSSPLKSQNSIFDDLAKLYPQIEFNIIERSPFIIHDLQLTESDFFRFITNIVKNSIESISTQLNIETHVSDGFMKISFSDNGSGVEPSLIPKIIDGHTTKISGNGLGVSGINTALKKIGGAISIDSRPGRGFTLHMKIPMKAVHEEFVLIDDDKIVRIGWEAQAKKKGIKLSTFKTVADFISASSLIPAETIIYVDSNLGEGIKGEIESEKIFQMGYKDIFLATGYSNSDLNLETTPWIKGSTSKRSPF